MSDNPRDDNEIEERVDQMLGAVPSEGYVKSDFQEMISDDELYSTVSNSIKELQMLLTKIQNNAGPAICIIGIVTTKEPEGLRTASVASGDPEVILESLYDVISRLNMGGQGE